MDGITGKGLKLLQEKQSGGGGVNEEIVAAMHPVLIGPALDVMNRKMTSGLCSLFETTKTLAKSCEPLIKGQC